MGDGGELERALDDVFGIKVTVRYLYKPKERTNTGKQTVAFSASVLWDDIPVDLKNLSLRKQPSFFAPGPSGVSREKPKCLQIRKKIKPISAVRATF